MAKRKKVIYWVATVWLSLGMVSTGVVQLIKMEEEVNNFTKLGFPLYLLTILGVWKILGVAAVLIPKYPLVKEWAYAGFFFAMSGAIIAHLAVGDDMLTLFGPALLIVMTVISWYFRPAGRRITSVS